MTEMSNENAGVMPAADNLKHKPADKPSRRAWLKQHRRYLLRLGLLLLLALLAAGGLLARGQLSRELPAQQAAERWRGESEMRFAQVSAFLPLRAGFDEAKVYAFRQSLDAALLNASLEAPESGALWADAYSGQGTLSLSVGKSSAQAEVIGVGGDFFLFHPLRLRSGSYIGPTDINYDRLVLDEELAWKLFGAIDVAGMSVTINGAPYQVAGVVEREDDYFSSHAYTAGAGAYIAWSTLAQLDPDAVIISYELAAPDPISGFALKTVSEYSAFAQAAIIENSARYQLAASFSLIADFGLRSMVGDHIAYPYWENAARMLDDYLALLLILTLICALPPGVALLVFLIRLIRRKYRALKRRVTEARAYH